MKLSELDDTKDDLPFLCDFIVRDGESVQEVKQKLATYLATSSVYAEDATSDASCYRLRHRNGATVTRVYPDDYKFGDEITFKRDQEVVLQLVEGTPVEVPNDPLGAIVFIRKWNPDTQILEPFQELALSGSCV